MESGPSTVGAALAEFLEDCQISGKAERTIYTYGHKLRGRLDLDAPLTSLDSRACRALMVAECRSKAPSTASAFCGALSSFCKWCVGRGYLPISPMLNIPTPKVPEGPNKALSERQVAALFSAARDDRERLMLHLFLSTGCRRAEIAAATWADIDWERGCLAIVGKGSKAHRVALDEATLKLLRGKCALNARETRASILGWSSATLYYRFKLLAKRAGLPWAHPHMLRHTYFTDSIRRGMSPLAAQTLGGWSDQRMLLRYSAAAVEEAALNEARRLQRVPREV